ncbi:MAG: hypothetical protein ACP5DY_01310 [Thermovirgaceae bacterium]
MRKSLFFWLTVVIAASVVAVGFLYFGRKSVTETLADVLPGVDEGVPHALVMAPGDQIQIGGDVPDSLAEEASPSTKPYLNLMEGLLPLAGLSQETALLATWAEEANRAEMYGVFLFPREEVSLLSSGRLPEPWREVIPEASLERTGEKNRYRLQLVAGAPGMYLETADRLVLVSLQEGGIARMRNALEDPGARLDVRWTVETGWPGHLYLDDGGVLAASASMQGQDVGDDPVRLEAAWRKTGDDGLLAWGVSGIEGWIPDKIKEGLTGHAWSETFFIPDPLIAAAGFNLPAGIAKMPEITSELPRAAEALGVDTGLLQKILEGPLFLAFGGQSRFLVVNLPGFLVQLPGRGAAGENFIEALWNRHWMRLSLTPKPLPGFETGGTLAVPLTVVGAASEELALLGAMEESGLKKRVPVRDVFELPGSSLAWMYLDFPKMADALENVARAGSLAQRVGLSGGEDLEDIALAAEELRKFGRILMVMEDYRKGRIRWQQAPEGGQ